MDEYGRRIPSQSDEWRKSPSRKKDTTRWCKGHVGREHVRDVRLQRWPYVLSRTCRPIPPDGPRFLGTDRHGYICYHEVYCSTCGKILAATPERCPLNLA